MSSFWCETVECKPSVLSSFTNDVLIRGRDHKEKRKWCLSRRQSRNWELERTSCDGENPIENLPELRWVWRGRSWREENNGMQLVTVDLSSAGSQHSNVLWCRNYHGSVATPLGLLTSLPFSPQCFCIKYHKILAVWVFDSNWLRKTTKQDGRAGAGPTRRKEFEEFLGAAPAPALAANGATRPGILNWMAECRKASRDGHSATARIKWELTGEFARPN